MKKRESNIELLRLGAMFLIVFNHFPWMIEQILDGSQGVFKYVLLNTVGILSNFGGLGDDLFFMISAWFLCLETPSIKKSCLRAWMLEQRMLFYSIGLMILSVVLFRLFSWGNMPSTKDIVLSFIPFVGNRWWYTTSYIVFLFLHPFINQGLRSIGKDWHLRLVIVSILLWGFIPYFDINLDYSAWLFLYLYAIVSYARWYLNEYLKARRLAIFMIATGLFIGLITNICSQFLKPSGILHSVYLNEPRALPSMLMAMGLLIFVNSTRRFHSSIVNKLAASTVAMYLTMTTVFPLAISLTQTSLSGVNGFALIGYNAITAIACYILVLFIDLIRQTIFDYILVRNPGKWFEQLWDHVSNNQQLKTLIRCSTRYIKSLATSN